ASTCALFYDAAPSSHPSSAAAPWSGATPASTAAARARRGSSPPTDTGPARRPRPAAHRPPRRTVGTSIGPHRAGTPGARCAALPSTCRRWVRARPRRARPRPSGARPPLTLAALLVFVDRLQHMLAPMDARVCLAAPVLLAPALGRQLGEHETLLVPREPRAPLALPRYPSR